MRNIVRRFHQHCITNANWLYLLMLLCGSYDAWTRAKIISPWRFPAITFAKCARHFFFFYRLYSRLLASIEIWRTICWSMSVSQTQFKHWIKSLINRSHSTFHKMLHICNYNGVHTNYAERVRERLDFMQELRQSCEFLLSAPNLRHRRTWTWMFTGYLIISIEEMGNRIDQFSFRFVRRKEKSIWTHAQHCVDEQQLFWNVMCFQPPPPPP